MVGDDAGNHGDDAGNHGDENVFAMTIDQLQLNQERAALQAEVVKWCTKQILHSNERNPLAPPDPNKYFKDRLCELQIQVLERSKVIAQLQAKLTELIINCPESALSLQQLKQRMEHVTVRRSTNKYGYGQDVVNIACNTLDSVKNLVDQVPDDLSSEAVKEQVYRSLSETAAAHREVARGRSLSSNHVSCSTLSNTSSFPSSNPTETRDIRALSNLEMNDSVL